jgi:hypothetical protein
MLFQVLAPCRIIGRYVLGKHTVIISKADVAALKMKKVCSLKCWDLRTTLHNSKSQNIIIIILPAVKTSNLTIKTVLFSHCITVSANSNESQQANTNK